jgi:Tfp pilus assembly protein PilV
MSLYRQTAFSLLEIVIALALLSFIILNLTAWQLKVRMQALVQYQAFVAIQILQSIAADMHSANPIISWPTWQKRVNSDLPEGHLVVINNQLSLSWKAKDSVWHCPNPIVAERACLSVELAL